MKFKLNKNDNWKINKYLRTSFFVLKVLIYILLDSKTKLKLGQRGEKEMGYSNLLNYVCMF